MPSSRSYEEEQVEDTPIYDRVEQELGICPPEQVRPPWSFQERDAAIRRSLRADSIPEQSRRAG